ncbi:16S rRNA (adenine(1518)-N(6)/adenine(1519)-N(6))-dimethyltransferase RsmA [Paracoccaceae bacterium]|nr:16S rRNA (adenine(1518)-N(6)/adenine(1519)-N(6))-dimethyltransferase RsmA [Paracoccaceae bacterium]
MHNLAPKKKFGQNFLTDQTVIERIVSSAGQLENKSILEIGGGSGNLTKHLIKAKPKDLIVVEIDKDYIDILGKIMQNSSIKTTLISDDILKTDIYSYFSEPPVIFGNLPYNVSTKILAKLLNPSNDKNKWEKLFLMFQLEVANRIVATPNTKEYGRLSLFSQFYSFPSLEFQIPKTSFFPIPKVESALVKFQSNCKYYNKHNSELFRAIIKKSFQGRRKMIKNTLKTSYKNITELMAISNIPQNSRPENITLQQFCQLTDTIDKSRT